MILILATSALLTVTTASAATTTITINSSGTGRTFDGIGAISGGGGTSRLLWDYPAQQQSEILDFLFKPNYGASLQILKVEIGGDTNTSEGAEASHMRTSGSENYQRGYEWWLMEQAKARNPNIKFAALEWGAPGWFSGGFWSTDNINYIIKWIQHAQSDHGITISYIGGWNERGYNITWYQNLRTALNNAGLGAVKIVADDGLGSSNWAVANDLSSNAAFKAAVSIAGTHYTNTSTSTAQGLGMPLWSSENGSVDYDSGGATVANKINLDYINGKMTAYLHWNAVAAYYRTLPFYPWGTILADEPWSGYYKVGRNVWALAHTAQFAQPGWKYIDSASGALAGGGSYVTLKSTNNSDYSIIFETNGASASQTVNVSVSGLSTGVVHVWSTNLASTSPSTYMVKGSDVTPSGGSYSLTLQPGYAYSVTTTTGQGKGSTTPPASAVMGIPYADNFEGYGATGKLAKYFSDLNGAFETANCSGGHSGMCYRQVINVAPISWTTSPGPTTVFGDPRWTNYQVSVDALLEQTGSVDLVGRMNLNTHAQTGNQGYHLQVNSSGTWSLLRQVAAGTNTTLASGTVSFPTNSWHNLALDMQGATIKAYYDNALIATVTDSTWSTGQVVLQTGGWQLAQFDNFSVTASHTTGPTQTPGPTATRTNTPTAGPSLTPTRTPTPGGSSNLAQGKTASADSVQTANPVANGNDGSAATRWCAANGNLNHWWMVDLGASHVLTGSEVMWETARNYKYKVEVSTDNATWTLVVDKTASTSTAQTQTDNFTATARYVRITVTGLTTSPATWASFFEFRVFGS
jgi:hypothetical protein